MMVFVVHVIFHYVPSTHTQLQFVAILVHTLNTEFSGCDYPMWGQRVITGYMITLLTLFGNFYLHAYIKGQRTMPSTTTHVDDDAAKKVSNSSAEQNGVGAANGAIYSKGIHTNGTIDKKKKKNT